jgi:hypothetical protein
MEKIENLFNLIKVTLKGVSMQSHLNLLHFSPNYFFFIFLTFFEI